MDRRDTPPLLVSESCNSPTSVFTIREIKSRWNDTIRVPEVGVLCVVGANNVGKSRFLGEVLESFDHPSNYPPRVLIETVSYDLNLSASNYSNWFERAVPRGESYDGRIRYRTADGNNLLDIEEIGRTLFEYQPGVLGPASGYFVHSLPFTERSAILAANIGSGNMQIMGSPLNRLFRSPELERRLSEISSVNFGFPLTLDRFNGSVELRVGKPETGEYKGTWYTQEYANAVLRLPSLTSQGDGVKNYIGIALNTLTTEVAVTIIDEPEAFLHPAQARALGRFLGKTTHERKNQLLVATHDRDFVVGLLDSGVPLTVVRLNRRGDVTTFETIDSTKIESIWENPFLRFSNLLQGLFHKVVVLCEADADCMWYSAVASHVGESEGVDTHEILFVPGGGKSQLPSSLASLVDLGVRVFTLTDFDSLVDGQTMASILHSKGIRDQDVERKLSSLSRSVKNNGSYQNAKRFGLNGLGQGDEAKLGTELVESLREYDILVVQSGELESFDRSIGGKGSAWVSPALSNRLYQQSMDAHACVRPIVDSLKP